MRLPLSLALLDRWHVVLCKKVVWRLGHEVLQSGVSAFAGLNETQTRFEISGKPRRNIDLPFPAVLWLMRDSLNRACAATTVATGSGAGRPLPLLCLSACCKFCIFDMWTFRLVDLFTNKTVEPFKFKGRSSLWLLLQGGAASCLRFGVDVETA